MDKIIIGSAALKYWYSDLNRTPKDLDYAVKDTSIFPKEKGVEYLENPILFENVEEYTENGYLKPQYLYTLKMSHLFWDINWSKHEYDATFLRNKGCKLNYPLFYKLYDYFNELHGKNKRSDLKMSAADFFDNALKCEYDHDWLHILLNPIPTYTKVLQDGKEVEVSEDKFNKLSFEDKCNLVYKEVEVMSWERWPNMDYRIAYSRMLKKFIINHAPLYEAIFILENYVRLCRSRRNHFKILNEKIKEYGNQGIERTTKKLTES